LSYNIQISSVSASHVSSPYLAQLGCRSSADTQILSVGVSRFELIFSRERQYVEHQYTNFIIWHESCSV